MWYRGRPGLSPANAALVAAGVLEPGSLVLDVGCGNGEESVGLALHGFPVVGVDRVPRALAAARARARSYGVAASTWFLEGDAERLDALFAPATFDAAVDVLLYNNVRFGDGGGDAHAARYLRSLARVLRRGAVASVQWRIDPDVALPPTSTLLAELPDAALDAFEPATPIATHLPVHPERRAGRSHAAVALLVLRRR